MVERLLAAIAGDASQLLFTARPAGDPIAEAGQLVGDIAANFAEPHNADMEVGGGALGIELPGLGPLVGQRPVEMALKPQDAPQGIFEHAVAKIFIDHPAQRDLAGEQRGRQMIDPGGRGLDQLQPRRTGQQLRVREPAAGVLGVARRLVMGQKRRDVGKLLQGGADIAGEIRVVTIHHDSDIRHRR